MFTGLITQTCSIVALHERQNGLELKLGRPIPWDDLQLGESISVNGACLTLTSVDSASMDFFVSSETLMKTTLGILSSGALVNLERSLTLSDRLGGHLVSGHIDQTGRVSEVIDKQDGLWVRIQLPFTLMEWVVPKGSIAIDGVSLTVNEVNLEENYIEIFLIPETLARTSLGNLKAGSLVNVECDQMVKIIVQKMSLMGVHREQHL